MPQVVLLGHKKNNLLKLFLDVSLKDSLPKYYKSKILVERVQEKNNGTEMRKRFVFKQGAGQTMEGHQRTKSNKREQ